MRELGEKDTMVEIEYNQIEPNEEYDTMITQVIKTCFEEEQLINKNVEMNVILTIPEVIRNINAEYRKVDKETDVLSFPMFEKEEVTTIQKNGSKIPEVLGDIVISIPQVVKQAEEYGHSFERELAYMVVHGFYHIIGYDHMEEQDKKEMRQKEEVILKKIGLERELEK